MARQNRYETAVERRHRLEEEKKFAKAEAKVNKENRKLQRISERGERRKRLEEKAEAGDPFAQSKLESEEKSAQTAQKLGKRSARAKFRSSAYRRRRGLKDTKEDLRKVEREEIARSGFLGMDGGEAGGRRATEVFDTEQQEKREKLETKAKAKKTRFDKAKETEAKKTKARKEAFDRDYKEQIDFYTRNPQEVESDKREGFFDLAEEFNTLKGKKLKGVEFNNALAELSAKYNQFGDTQILDMYEKNGNLHLVTDYFGEDDEIVLNKAKLKAIREVGGKSRQEDVARAKALAEEARKRQAGIETTVAREERGEERQIAGEQRREEAQIRKEGRAKVQASAESSRRIRETEVKGQLKAEQAEQKAVTTAKAKEFDFKRKRLESEIIRLKNKKKLNDKDRENLAKLESLSKQYDVLAESRTRRQK